ncbi:MAG: mandelate racemase/muconate lactonizing enzyme family protein [Haloarculaceae archaeon]
MEITAIRCVRRRGTMYEYPDGTFTERILRPTDVYPEFRETGPERDDAGDGPRDLSQVFVEVDTDAGVTGVAGPVADLTARAVLDVADVLVGLNALATAKVQDVLFGRWDDATAGTRLRAASAIDVALWDARGKHYGAPVHELLGGPTRTELPCYASMLGFSTDPDSVRERAAEYADRGFPAQKWFFRHGPGSGEDGKAENVAMAEAAREAVGDGDDLMFDAWRSWGMDYAMDMLDRLAPSDPRWLEQPLDKQYRDGYARLVREAPFPIAGGEHDATRWDFREVLSAGALEVLQPEPFYTGGVTETDRVCTLGSTHGVTVVPHGNSVPVNVQLVAAQPPSLCPYVEFLVQRNATNQFFFEETVWPEDGHVAVPDRPGIGVTIDDSVVESETELSGP